MVLSNSTCDLSQFRFLTIYTEHICNTSNFLSSSLATVYSTPEELGRAAVFSEVASHSSNRAKSSRNFCHKRHVSSILTERKCKMIYNNNNDLFPIHTSHSFCFHQTSDILLESPLHRQGTDAPPAAIKATSRLLDGVALCIGGAGVTVVQKHLTQIQYGRHSCTVLLDVPLKLLSGEKEERESMSL